METICLDLSHHNATPDWRTLKANGIRAIIHKATEGTSYVDDEYAARRAQAIEAGLGWSSYHFLKHGDVADQAAHFLDVVDPADGERLVIDYEDPACTLDDLEAMIITLRKQAEVELTVYGANGFLGAQLKGKKNDTLASCSLWVASYTSASAPTMTDLKGTWPAWSLWQFTDKAKIAGMGPFDGNRWNGTPEAFDEWIEPAGVPEPLPPEPVPVEVPVVTIHIETEGPVKLRVTVGDNVTIVE